MGVLIIQMENITTASYQISNHMERELIILKTLRFNIQEVGVKISIMALVHFIIKTLKTFKN
jgi:hypothetical protein